MPLNVFDVKVPLKDQPDIQVPLNVSGVKVPLRTSSSWIPRGAAVWAAVVGPRESGDLQHANNSTVLKMVINYGSK